VLGALGLGLLGEGWAVAGIAGTELVVELVAEENCGTTRHAASTGTSATKGA